MVTKPEDMPLAAHALNEQRRLHEQELDALRSQVRHLQRAVNYGALEHSKLLGDTRLSSEVTTKWLEVTT